jgi:hypothetical protein
MSGDFEERLKDVVRWAGGVILIASLLAVVAALGYLLGLWWR